MSKDDSLAKISDKYICRKIEKTVNYLEEQGLERPLQKGHDLSYKNMKKL